MGSSPKLRKYLVAMERVGDGWVVEKLYLESNGHNHVGQSPGQHAGVGVRVGGVRVKLDNHKEEKEREREMDKSPAKMR